MTASIKGAQPIVAKLAAATEAANGALATLDSVGLQAGRSAVTKSLNRSLQDLQSAMRGIDDLGARSPFGAPTVLQANHGQRHLQAALSRVDLDGIDEGLFRTTVKEAAIRVNLSRRDAQRTLDGHTPLRFGSGSSGGVGTGVDAAGGPSRYSGGNIDDLGLDDITGHPPRLREGNPEWGEGEFVHNGGAFDAFTGESYGTGHVL